jgi:hypothetical protein
MTESSCRGPRQAGLQYDGGGAAGAEAKHWLPLITSQECAPAARNARNAVRAWEALAD